MKTKTIVNPFLNYKNPEIQRKLQSWNRTCDEVAKENEVFVKKQKKYYEDLSQSDE